MIIKTKLRNPHEWHNFFAIMPVLIAEQKITEPNVNIIVQTKAFLQYVERRLVRNMSGTEKWEYRVCMTSENTHD